MSRQFYTYLHCKPNMMPFYVGKGFGKRAYNLVRRRNPHHQHIVKKYGAQNILVFVFPCDSEIQALADEIQHIAQLRRDGFELCNQTNGGDGVSNPTPAIREKIGRGQRGKKRAQEHCKRLSQSRKDQKFPPEYSERMSAAMHKRYSDPNERKRTSEATKAALQRPEIKSRKSEASKAMWACTDYRIKKVEELRSSNPKGENCSWAKITNSDVVAIRCERESGIPLVALSKKYGVSIASISGIANRRTWKSVP